MTAGPNISKMFTCCRQYQHSVCLKLWIMVFVCSLLCFTCLVIETRRGEIIKSRSLKVKQGAQKLIQIKSSFDNFIAKSNDIEESSGYYEENIALSSEQYPVEENDPTVDYHANEEDNSREMLAASNCVSKSSGLLNPTGHETKDFSCTDLIERVKQILEYPEISETEANNIFSDYEVDTPLEHHPINEYEWVDKLEEEVDFSPFQPDEEDEPTHQFGDSENSMPVTWESEDRFFPDEYAFQIKSSEDFYTTEPRHNAPATNDLISEKLSPSDIPSMIDTFLGKISTLFVPSMHVRKPDLGHLSNFKDAPFSIEGMRLASSKLNPVRSFNSNKRKDMLSSPLNPTFHTRSRRNPNEKIIDKHKNDDRLLPNLLRILQEK